MDEGSPLLPANNSCTAGIKRSVSSCTAGIKRSVSSCTAGIKRSVSSCTAGIKRSVSSCTAGIKKSVGSCGACIKKSLSIWSLFYLFCFLSGQYINFEILKKPSSPESPSGLQSGATSESPSGPQSRPPSGATSESPSQPPLGTTSEPPESPSGSQSRPPSGATSESPSGPPLEATSESPESPSGPPLGASSESPESPSESPESPSESPESPSEALSGATPGPPSGTAPGSPSGATSESPESPSESPESPSESPESPSESPESPSESPESPSEALSGATPGPPSGTAPGSPSGATSESPGVTPGLQSRSATSESPGVTPGLQSRSQSGATSESPGVTSGLQSGSQSGATSRSSSESSCKKFISVLALLLFAGQILVYFGYVGTALAVEGFTIANVSYTTSIGNDKIICMLPQEHWKFTTAITISTIAAFFSYSLMTFFVLIPVNSIHCCSSKCCCSKCCCSEGCCTAYIEALRDSALSPFNDDEESSKLSAKEMGYFFTNYVVVLGLFICSFISSFLYAHSVFNRGYCWMNALYLAMIVLHLCSQFCAIHSCFIFSKIIYKVTNKLKNLAKTMEQVNVSKPIKADSEMLSTLKSLVEVEKDVQSKKELESIQDLLKPNKDKEEVDRGLYHWLQKMDQNFIKQVKPMLELFGLWFIVHWTLYALTTVLLSAFIVQIIIEVIQYNFNTAGSFLPNGEADTKAPYVFYVVFFTLVHAYLFLYPCFRAAAIGTARMELISTISKKQWINIPLSVQNNFVQYLTSEKFAFRVPLFCANVAFGFNWAFVSFFIAICGAYLRF